MSPSLLPPQNELAKMVIDAVPSVEMVRFCSSGTVRPRPASPTVSSSLQRRFLRAHPHPSSPAPLAAYRPPPPLSQPPSPSAPRLYRVRSASRLKRLSAWLPSNPIIPRRRRASPSSA